MTNIAENVDNLKLLAEKLSPFIDRVAVSFDCHPMPEIGNIIEENLGLDSEAGRRIMMNLSDCERQLDELISNLRVIRDDIDDTATLIAQ
jgi:hypothetical protein